MYLYHDTFHQVPRGAIHSIIFQSFSKDNWQKCIFSLSVYTPLVRFGKSVKEKRWNRRSWERKRKLDAERNWKRKKSDSHGKRELCCSWNHKCVSSVETHRTDPKRDLLQFSKCMLWSFQWNFTLVSKQRNSKVRSAHQPCHLAPWTPNGLANIGHYEAEWNTARPFWMSLLPAVNLSASEMSWIAPRGWYMFFKINSENLSIFETLVNSPHFLQNWLKPHLLWGTYSVSPACLHCSTDECLWTLTASTHLSFTAGGWGGPSPRVSIPSKLLHFSGRDRVGLRAVYVASPYS